MFPYCCRESRQGVFQSIRNTRARYPFDFIEFSAAPHLTGPINPPAAEPPPPAPQPPPPMPEMTGWEAIRQIKGDAATGKIPIIALTSAQTAGDRDEAYGAGCDAYEAKPIDMPRILARIKELTGA
jgi:hypothetical protein